MRADQRIVVAAAPVPWMLSEPAVVSAAMVISQVVAPAVAFVSLFEGVPTSAVAAAFAPRRMVPVIRHAAVSPPEVRATTCPVNE